MLREVLRLTNGEIKTTTKLKLCKCLFCESENTAVIANLSSDKMGTIDSWYVECRKYVLQEQAKQNHKMMRLHIGTESHNI